MTTVINTTQYGLHELHARYDAKYKVATFNKYTVYHTRPAYKMGEIELTKEDVYLMLKYFCDMEDKRDEAAHT
ncbi:hypothetical protein [Metasolibacillus meyeri]|uniref:hypothetical protein n=1 Tax=Metasolibacillus meyeri TaxID=1071052 RepID=UPI000D31AB4E|nr:hypothetical protein [Metasolibacillus meyeri]